MKKFMQPVLSLTLIAAVCAAVLAAVNSVTQVRIGQIKVEAARHAAKRVMPAEVKTVETVEGRNGEPDSFIGKAADGKDAGYAIVGRDSHGYGGDIALMVGFSPDFKIIGYVKLEASETPGLGSKLSTPEFSGQFKGMDARRELKVKKDGGDVEAITSATITSRAVCAAINAAKARLDVILAARR